MTRLARPKNRMRAEETRLGLLLMLPSALCVLIFSTLPILGSLGVSLTDWGGLSVPKFVGLDNYVTAFQDERARRALLTTLKYVAVSVVPGVTISLTLAVLIHNLSRGWLRSYFRTVFYLPMVTIGVAVALLWQVLLSPTGLINLLLRQVGVQGPDWLGDPQWVLIAIAMFSVWQGAGQGIILFLTALANVSKEQYEAAQLDGASPWQSFRYVTLPMISPTLFLVLILSLIGSLQVFDAILVLTKGGPGDASTSMAMYVYNTAFQYFKMGYASALAWILSAILMVFIVWQWRLQNRWVNYDQG